MPVPRIPVFVTQWLGSVPNTDMTSTGRVLDGTSRGVNTASMTGDREENASADYFVTSVRSTCKENGGGGGGADKDYKRRRRMVNTFLTSLCDRGVRLKAAIHETLQRHTK